MNQTVQENPVTHAIVDQIDQNTPDDRMKHIMKSLVRHLHAFVQDVRITEDEWKNAIDFLTRTGQKCDDQRQEFVLLSDVLGVSILVDALNHDPQYHEDIVSTNAYATGTTDSTILGPFFRQSVPTLENGSMLTTPEQIAKGTPLVVDCRVVDGPTNIPVTNCTVNVWQASADGLYDVQATSTPTHDSADLRGVFHPDDHDGRFWFTTVQPSSYPIPTDGPVGELLAAMGKHPYRPAHIHFQIQAPGFESLTTHLFLEGDPYLTSDAVHAVKDSLIVGLSKMPTDDVDALSLDSIYKERNISHDQSSDFFGLKYTFRLQQRRHRRGLNDKFIVDTS